MKQNQMDADEQARLLRWFDRHQRALPWRTSRDPYQIWVSEVMLQQTTVAVVAKRFPSFIKRFPTVEALATASLEAVLREWEGLGYYRRAQHLHQAANIILTNHRGIFPRAANDAAALPGVGRYILGAVLSQAYDLPLPIVEANSLRVLCRRFGFRNDPRTPRGQRWLWNQAARILPAQRSGDFNQALMELGALVCKPKSPECSQCPLAKNCIARKQAAQERIPRSAQRRKPIPVHELALVIRNRGRLLVCQRSPNASRWAGFWEFPHDELREGESTHDAVNRIARELLGMIVRPGEFLGTVRHTFTRFQIRLDAWEAKAAARYQPRLRIHTSSRWCTADDFSRLPAASPQRALFKIFSNRAK